MYCGLDYYSYLYQTETNQLKPRNYEKSKKCIRVR